MIKEIRIGNWVYMRTFGYKHETQIDWDDFEPINDGRDQIEPINISMEWLERFGFEVEGLHTKYDTDIDYLLIRKGTFYVSVEEESSVFHLFFQMEDDFYSFASTRINYVHQLQNLHFSITGTELTVNDKV